MPTCFQCSADFSISKEHLAFYDLVSPVIEDKKFSIPTPKFCPMCRAQRRYVWRGELHLFKRKSAFSNKPIVTYIPPESSAKVYDANEWWSESWDPLSYGRDFDFSRPFFPQFKELLENVPQLSRCVPNNVENAEYTNCASWNKNCYLLGGANYNEDCYYGNYVNRSKSCLDCNFIDTCELCYECVDCTNCYNLKYSYNCNTCSNSYFMSSCRNCQDCFGCVNLVGKKFHFCNQELSPAEYKKRLSEINLGSRNEIQRLKTEHEKFRLTFPHRYMIGELNEDSTGNSLRGCKDSTECFDVSDLWDCHYCHWLHKAKNCMDVISWGFPAELCYECVEAGDGAYHNLFCVSCYGSQESLYSSFTMFSKNCFACVGVKNSQYCILNKRYEKEEYYKEVKKIIGHMQQSGEWGEFFPISISPLCYNTSIAQDYFPLDAASAENLGWRWHHESDDNIGINNYQQLPDDIENCDESICATTFKCSETGKSYKIIKPEFEFYKKNGIPLPNLCFNSRHKIRLAKRTPRQLWERKCGKCQAAIQTSYAPFRPEVVFCETCYRAVVY